MKQRRSVIAIFLMVAILTLGIGYAQLSDALDITGSAATTAKQADTAFKELVYFSDANAAETGDTASVNSDNNNKASFSVTSLATEGDVATFTFVVTNESDLAATVSVKPSSSGNNPYNNNAEYYKVTYQYGADGQGNLPAKTSDTEFGTMVITVTVELIKTPQVDITGSFLVELEVKTVAETNG
jgi:hypothetical protein